MVKNNSSSTESAPPGWFQEQQMRYTGQNDTLRGYLFREIVALEAFHDGDTGPDEAAHAITRPVSESPVPDLGTYSDELVVGYQLWELYTSSLDEWPASRTRDLINLGHAISRVPDKIHRGEATDDHEQPRTWRDHPYLDLAWYDAHWMFPEQILQKEMDSEARREARDIYIKKQLVEAQLVAAGILGWHRAIRAIGHALEQEEHSKIANSQHMVRDREDEEGETKQIIMKDREEIGQQDFDIVAKSYWIEHVGDRLYLSLMKDESWENLCSWRLPDMSESETPDQSCQSPDRWDYLMGRYYKATDAPNG